MAEAELPSAIEKPRPDPSELVLALERLAAPSAREEAVGKRSWVGYLLVILAGLLGTAVLSWILFRQSREFARLRHRENRDEILAENAKIERRAATFEEAVAVAEKAIEASEARLQSLQAERSRIVAKHAADLASLS